MFSSGFGGCEGRAPRPPKFLQVYAVFGKNWPNNRLSPPLRVDVPMGNPGSATGVNFLLPVFSLHSVSVVLEPYVPLSQWFRRSDTQGSTQPHLVQQNLFIWQFLYQICVADWILSGTKSFLWCKEKFVVNFKIHQRSNDTENNCF